MSEPTRQSTGGRIAIEDHPTPADVLREAGRYLAAHGVESPRATAEALLAHVLGTDRTGLYARRAGLSAAEGRAYSRALCQRCADTPLQYLTGEQRFMDLTLEVAPGVFVPRPETEVLVESALQLIADLPGPVVVDVGTGIGAIAVAIKHRRHTARVLATDVSEVAVTLARKNAARHGLDVEVLQGDLLGPVPDELRSRVDLLASNPPYVRREDYEALPKEVKAEPYEALVGGTEFHRRLVDGAAGWLSPDGWLVVEIGADQGPEVGSLFERRLADVAVLPDLAGRDRIVRGRLPAGQP